MEDLLRTTPSKQFTDLLRALVRKGFNIGRPAVKLVTRVDGNLLDSEEVLRLSQSGRESPMRTPDLIVFSAHPEVGPQH